MKSFSANYKNELKRYDWNGKRLVIATGLNYLTAYLR
jgi:hypothetical protein